MTWGDILSRWHLVVADMHELYGIEVDDISLLRARPWRWLKTRIAGLASCDSRLSRAMTPDKPSKR